MSSTANMMRRMPNVFTGAFGSAGGRRLMELAQLEPAVAVRRPHHRDVASDTIERNEATRTSGTMSTKRASTISESAVDLPREPEGSA